MGRLIWLVNQERAADAEMTVGICEIEPGASNPEHFQSNCEEVLFVLEGECEHTLGDELMRLTPGMMIRCPTHLPHHTVNTGSVPLRALICYSAPDRRTEHVGP
jgi:mannose-6-phosphate isomerase-like protein (cupin superfamily)